MNKLISIVGPTASGKTQTAWQLAKHLIEQKKFQRVDLISADSRQVYQGMEILTGSDLPADYRPGPIYFHGISLIRPDQEWSLAHFQNYAWPIMINSWQNQGLVILVGGTGLYHDHLLSTDQQIGQSPNLAVRQKASELSLAELQNWLREVDQVYFDQLNHSDQYNPRRLIRALEIKLADRKLTATLPFWANWVDQIVHRYVGLMITDLADLKSKIEKRVIARLDSGVLAEVEKLLADYPPNLPAFSATGMKEINSFLASQIDRNQLIELWTRREFQYAKRQLTWWKKHPDMSWLASDDHVYLKIDV